MFRRYISICVLIWAAIAAQSVFAQSTYVVTNKGRFGSPSQADAICRLTWGSQCGPAVSSQYCGSVATPCTVAVFRRGTSSTFDSYAHGHSCATGTYASSAGRCLANSTPEWTNGVNVITGTPYNELGIDQNGFTQNGCYNSVCPGDPGYVDAQGYDNGGFNSQGVDRGGKTAAQGGGYGGIAGTGGTPPPGYTAPPPPDYNTGDNLDDYGVYQCQNANPLSAPKSLIPATVLDGLAGCGNSCEYQPSSVFYDFDFNQEVVLLTPTGYPCDGNEPSLANLFNLHTTAPEVENPVDPNHHLNFCYTINGYYYCKSPTDTQPTCYVKYQDGGRGVSVGCAKIQPDTTQPDQVCGTANGVYQCIDNNSRCQSFQGTLICVDPSNKPIPLDSPDHPINGGNGDGLNYNDVFQDTDDVQQNGTQVQDRIVRQLNASEIGSAVAKALDPDLNAIRDSLQSPVALPNAEQYIVESTGAVSDALQGVADGSGDFTYDTDAIFGETNFFGNLFPSATSCQNFDFPILPEYNMVLSIDTCSLSVIKMIAEFLLYGLTVIALFYILIGKKQES